MGAWIDWKGPKWEREFEAGFRRNVSAACIYLTNAIKADISQSGTLRYTSIMDKRSKTIRNFTHSIAGNPPFKQTGRLRASISWEIVQGLVGRVGTNVLYGLFLDQGTRKMRPRPFLEANVKKHFATLVSILLRWVEPGALPPIVPNQSRSGYLGAGAKKAGYL